MRLKEKLKRYRKANGILRRQVGELTLRNDALRDSLRKELQSRPAKTVAKS